MPGIAGLRAGIEFVKKRGTDAIFRHEIALVQSLYDRLSRMKGIRLYAARPDFLHFAPVLSFNVGDVPSEVIGRELGERGVAVRAGLHCAPAAHRFMGTLEQGAVRVCPSAFSNMNEINGFVLALLKIIEKHGIK
jgi:selenocysteine lyase/cysteine desulfurase